MEKVKFVPAPNYLVATLVNVAETSIIDGPDKDKDVVARFGYIEAVGKNSDVPNWSRVVVFNSKLATHIKSMPEETDTYLIHKSAVIAHIAEATIICTLFTNKGVENYEVHVDKDTPFTGADGIYELIKQQGR